MSEVVIAKSGLSDILSFSKNDKTKSVCAVKLSEIGLPSKKTEHYRYFALDMILSSSYKIAEFYVEEVQESDKVEIVNGMLKKAPKDLNIKVLKDSFLDENHFDPMYYVNHALSQNVILIESFEDCKIEIKHIFDKSGYLIPYRIALKVGEGKNVEVFEEFEDFEAFNSLILYGFDAEVGKGASFVYNRVQDVSKSTYFMIGSHRINSLFNSKSVVRTYDMGEGKIFHNLKIDLNKEAFCEAKHLIYTDKEAQRGNAIKINHIGENVNTYQDARHVLKDFSRAIFDAVIKVENTGKGAIAHQNNKSILLNDKAYMVSKPQLEIYIDELEASHGSTTGAIDEEEIFYLQTRGISKKEAKKMIILGFMKEIIDEVEDKDKSEDVYKRFESLFKRDIQ